MRKSQGFTLIELLVVIAIIAILAAVLFPVFAGARERGRQTKCLANLKQLSIAISAYMHDYGGQFPSVGIYYQDGSPDWCGTEAVFGPVYVEKGSLWSYVRAAGIYVCPSDKNKKAIDVTVTWNQPKNYPLSYSINGCLHRKKLDAAITGDPSKVMMLIHESRETINDGLYLWYNNPWDKPDATHYEGTTIAYVDGHARYLKLSQLEKQQTSLPYQWLVE